MQVDASGKPVALKAVPGLYQRLPNLDVSCGRSKRGYINKVYRDAVG